MMMTMMRLMATGMVEDEKPLKLKESSDHIDPWETPKTANNRKTDLKPGNSANVE